MRRKVLITGATGLVGGYFLSRIIEKTDLDIVLIVRKQQGISSGERIRKVADYFNMSWERDRLTIYDGDVRKEHCGLTDNEYHEISEGLTDVFHAAAAVSFEDHENGYLADTNIHGTRHVLDLAHGDTRFFYIGTAYVAGNYSGTFTEKDLACGQLFNNEYERTKFTAEMLVRNRYAERQQLLTIIRPSVITGEYMSGKTFQFEGFYTLLRAVYLIQKKAADKRLYYPYVPGTTKNYIPIDYMTDMVEELFSDESLWGRCYHLVNHAPIKNTDMAALMKQVFNLEIVNQKPPVGHRPLDKYFSKKTEPFTPYFRKEPAFDCTNRNKLTSSRVAMPFTADYLKRLISYCLETNWGRRHGVYT